VRLSDGVFEIYRDEELIFSKRASGKFPAQNEIVTLVKALEAGRTLDEARAEIIAARPVGFLRRLLGRR
jgi:predicted Rdx family selenoprotein